MHRDRTDAPAARAQITPPPPPPPPPPELSTTAAAATGESYGSPLEQRRSPFTYAVDRADAVEVTALFGTTVMTVRQLSDPAGGRVRPRTWSMLFSGCGGSVAGLVCALAGQLGLGALLLATGSMLLVYGALRLRDERRSPHFSLGEAVDADVHLTGAGIPAHSFPLVEAAGDHYALLFSSAMSGELDHDGWRRSLRELVDSGEAQPDSGLVDTWRLVVPRGARLCVDIGDHTFIIDAGSAPQPLVSSWSSRVHATDQLFTGLSFAAHAALLLLVFAIPPDARALSVDSFDRDRAMLKYLTRPQQSDEKDVPAWLKKRTTGASGDPGKAHRGDEGKMGKKNAEHKRRRYQLEGPKENPDPHLAKRLAAEAVQHAGALGLIRSSQGSILSSILGRDSALGKDAEDALGNLVGDELGEADGLGGLGLTGTGRHGGGTGEGTIGQGKLDTIGSTCRGPGPCSGNGRYGDGVGRLRARKARAPRFVVGRAIVRGGLDKSIIRRVIRRNINAVKYCYEKELQSNVKLGGRVVVRFTIASTGRVAVSKVVRSTLGHHRTETCLARAVQRFGFPRPKNGGIVVVSYPFVFHAAGE